MQPPLSQRPTHFFTVDVEEYFQARALRSVVSRDDWLSRPSRVAKSIDQLLDGLDRHGARGTFFCPGWIARHRPQVVRLIAAVGHEIASHGFWHEQVTALEPAQFLEDVREFGLRPVEAEDIMAANLGSLAGIARFVSERQSDAWPSAPGRADSGLLQVARSKRQNDLPDFRVSKKGLGNP
jgi:peptidoglycan/xylan/chitin deacetylase (PgdA/CDA1 family)